MPKHAVFTLKLETELRYQFMAQAQACQRSASQIILRNDARFRPEAARIQGVRGFFAAESSARPSLYGGSARAQP